MQPAKDCIFYIFLRAEKTIYAQSLPHGIQEALCGLTFRTFLLFEFDGGYRLFADAKTESSSGRI